MSRRDDNRALAAELRARGILPTGRAWELARAGERDTATLLAANVAEGDTARRLEDGRLLPAGLRPGDYVAELGGTVRDAALDMTLGLWVVEMADGTELELEPLMPLTVTRKRAAPAWVREAAAAYRDARDAWEAGRESGCIAPTSVPGTAGAAVAMYQLSDAEYAEHVPRPRYADFVRAYADQLGAGREMAAAS